MNPPFPPTVASAAALVGRLALALVYLPAGLQKLGAYTGTAEYMASKGMTMIPVLLPLSIVVEVGAPLLLIFGLWTWLGAAALAGFTVIASLIFHDFWNQTGMEQVIQMTMFAKNIGLIGGLLLLVAFGPGRWSVAGRRAARLQG